MKGKNKKYFYERDKFLINGLFVSLLCVFKS